MLWLMKERHLIVGRSGMVRENPYKKNMERLVEILRTYRTQVYYGELNPLDLQYQDKT